MTDPTCPHCHKSLRVKPKCSTCRDTGRVVGGNVGPDYGSYFSKQCPEGCPASYTIQFGRNAA